MVPSAYDAYFAAAATAGAALIGLLFVAVSVRDETIFGPKAIPGSEALAVIAFTGLVNSFVVSLLGLVPGGNIGVAALVMGVLSSVTVVRLHTRLRWGRSSVVLGIALLAYTAQVASAIALIANQHDNRIVEDLAYVLFANLVVSLQRAWSLLRGKHLAGGAPPEGGETGA